MGKIVNFYITMDTDDCNALKKRAFELGFSSVQEYIRTWAKLVASGHNIFLGDVRPEGKNSIKRIRTAG